MPKQKKRLPIGIGQGQTLPKEIWVLFDADNGHPSSYRYLWWFSDKQSAIQHRDQQNKNHIRSAKLVGPFPYQLKLSTPKRQPAQKRRILTDDVILAREPGSFSKGGICLKVIKVGRTTKRGVSHSG